MHFVRVMNRTRLAELGHQVAVADSWWTRLRGLIGRPEPQQGEGLLLMNCQGVHMFWMRYPVDIVMLADDGTVLAVYPELRPRRWTKQHRRALAALELPAGTLERTGTRVGDEVAWTSGNGRVA